MIEKLKIAGISLLAVGVVGAGLVGGSMVFAQTNDSPELVFEGEQSAKRGGDGWQETYREEIHAEIAAILGLTTEELEAAREAKTGLADLAAEAGLTEDEFNQAVYDVQVSFVSQAVSDDVLTQEEADEILTRMAEAFENGEFPGKPGGKHGGKGSKGGKQGNRTPEWMEPYADDFKAGVAGILGLSVEELEAAREDGTHLDELTETAGLTEDEFKDAVYDLRVSFVNQAVADGGLTQEEADDILEKMAEHQENGGRPKGKQGKRGGQDAQNQTSKLYSIVLSLLKGCCPAAPLFSCS